MSSLSASSSVFPAPIALAHTYNSSGRLGMFVNPYACSCVTCVHHVAAEHADPMPAPVPALPPPSSPLMRSVGMSWAPGTGAASGGLATPSFFAALARSATGPSESAPVTLMRSSSVPEEEEESDGAAAAAPPLAAAATAAETEESALLERLKDLRDRLSLEQEAVHEQEFRSHDEMAAADQEWEFLDNKICAIDDLLRAFRRR